jgi:tryptophan 2,3-dioxygenase
VILTTVLTRDIFDSTCPKHDIKLLLNSIQPKQEPCLLQALNIYLVLTLKLQGSSATQLNPTQTGTMSPSSVEHLLCHQALLARRETPVIDQELENLRQTALEVFFQWQDGAREFQDLIPFVAILEKKVDLNRSLLKWEQEHITD